MRQSLWGKEGRNTAAAGCWLAAGIQQAVGSSTAGSKLEIGAARSPRRRYYGSTPPGTKLRATPEERSAGRQVRQHHPRARPYWQTTRWFPFALPWGETPGETSLGARGMHGGDATSWGGARRDVPMTARHTLSLRFRGARPLLRGEELRMLASLTRSPPPRELPPPGAARRRSFAQSPFHDHAIRGLTTTNALPSPPLHRAASPSPLSAIHHHGLAVPVVTRLVFLCRCPVTSLVQPAR